MRILHVVCSLDPAAGGPPYIAVKLATAQAMEGHEVGMLSYRVGGVGGEEAVKEALGLIPNSERVRHHLLPPSDRWERLTGSGAGRRARELVKDYDVVHLHGLWETLLVRTAAACRAAGVPYVVTPHGMLDPWSLSQRTLKKKIALAVAVRRMINGAAFLHLGNRDERKLIEPLGFTAQSELVPNGVFEAEVTDLPARGTFRRAHPKVGEKPYVVFLSRLHYKKGLDHLAEAFAAVAARLPEVQLVVAGPDGGARADFEQRIAAAGLGERVHVLGPIYGAMKVAVVNDADVFCLPSRQEGFSMAITEALGIGCPCVVSEACHYPEVEEAGAGYVVELEPGKVAEALYKVLSDPAGRDRMGAAGRALVLSRFTWPVIARWTLECYARHGPAVAAPVG